MSLFLSEQQEFTFYKVLTSYEEEFGIDKLVILIPPSWVGSVDMLIFSSIEIRVWAADAVGIRVKNASAKFIMRLDGE